MYVVFVKLFSIVQKLTEQSWNQSNKPLVPRQYSTLSGEKFRNGLPNLKWLMLDHANSMVRSCFYSGYIYAWKTLYQNASLVVS